MNDLLAGLRRTAPTPFLLAAVIGAAVLLVVGDTVVWRPWASEMSVLGQGWPDLIDRVSLVLFSIAPLVAPWRPALAVAVAALPLGVMPFDAQTSWPFTFFPAALIVGVVAMWRRPRVGLVAGLVAVFPPALYCVGLARIDAPFGAYVDNGQTTPSSAAFTWLLYVVAAVLALTVGWWMRLSALTAERRAELESRAEEVEREADVLGERARLARDLHDVVAHHVSLIAVRAETAPYTVANLSSAAKELFAAVADDSRRALDELRGVLGVLRRADGSADMAPVPTARDLVDLVTAARSAGDDVTWRADDLAAVDDAAGYVAYRVLQEALTNARRHAPGAAVEVSASARGRGMVVRVVNPAPDGAELVAGRGLTGMRERVEALGGSLDLARADGHFTLEAWLPGERT